MTSGTTSQNTVQVVGSGRKDLVPIVTAMAKSATRNSGTRNQITALAKAGTKLGVEIQIVVIPFQFTRLGQTPLNTAKTVILCTKNLAPRVVVPKKCLTSHYGATHPNTVTPVGN